MSKYSIALATANKLEQSVLNKLRADAAGKSDDLAAGEIAGLDNQVFSFVNNDMAEAERTGYSNYSYWGSTLRAFMKNKVAVLTLVIIVVHAWFFDNPAVSAVPETAYVGKR